MKKRPLILIALGVFGVVLIVSLLFRSGSIGGVTKHTVELLVTGYAKNFTITNTEDNKQLGQYSADKVSLSLAADTYDLVFETEGLGSVIKRIVVPVGQGVVTTINFAPTPTATEVVDDVAGSNEDIKTSGAKYFANDTWLVGSSTSTTPGAQEAYIVVAKFLNDAWVTVDIGTFIDTDFLRLEGAPPDLISYLEEIQ